MKPARLPHFDEVEIGRKIGYDLFKYGRIVETHVSHPSVAEGFLLAQVQAVRQQVPDRYTRKWLQVRINAYAKRRYVDEQVTPQYIKSIDVPLCPVMRVALTHGELLGTDWSIDRLNNDGAYAPSNLAVMGTIANQAKNDRCFEEVYALSQQSSASQLVEGLTPQQWLRLAALMLGPCFATNAGCAPTIPLVVPIPKHTVRQAMQQVQYVFTLKAGRPTGKNLLIKSFSAASGSESCMNRLHFLAEAVHSGLKGVEYPWDVWLIPGVMDLLVQWRSCMNDAAWAMAGEISRQLAGGYRINPQRLNTWNLANRGYL